MISYLQMKHSRFVLLYSRNEIIIFFTKMKLIDLIEYLKNSFLLEKLYESQKFNSESEAIIVYMKDSISLNSEICFFEIEETEDEMLFEKNGIKYFQFFPIDYAVSLIESDLNLKNNGYSNSEIAERLLSYRIKDA